MDKIESLEVKYGLHEKEITDIKGRLSRTEIDVKDIKTEHKQIEGEHKIMRDRLGELSTSNAVVADNVKNLTRSMDKLDITLTKSVEDLKSTLKWAVGIVSAPIIVASISTFMKYIESISS